MSDHLPKDAVMLLSVVNARLRDYYTSLDDLCKSLQADKEWIIRTLSEIDYTYNPSSNQFE